MKGKTDNPESSAVNLKHRFWYFCFNDMYPSGGIGDICFTSDSLDEVMHVIKKGTTDDNMEIFDAQERMLIAHKLLT